MWQWLRKLVGSGGGRAPVNTGHRPRIRARYDNAQNTDDNQRSWAMADNLSAKAANNFWVRRQLRMRSRQEVSNNPYLFGVCNGNADDLVGGTGPTLKVLTPDAAYNRRYERGWAEWAAEVAYVEKVRTCRLGFLVDGEGVLLFKTVADLQNPVKLYPVDVEADQVTTPAPSNLGELWVDGLVLHPVTGRPVAYHVLKHHPGDYYFGPDFNPLAVERVPARHVVHWFKKFRPGQVRGVPVFTPALDLFVELRSFRRAVLAKANIAANLTATLESEAPADADGTQTATPFDAIPIDRGMMTTMPHGMRMKQYESGEPGTTYEMFQEKCLGEACRPIGYPLGLALGTSQKFNFSSAKLDRVEYREGLRVERAECERVVLDPTLSAYDAEAVLADPRLRWDGGGPPPHEWHWPGFPTLDAAADTKADIDRIAAGTLTWREFWATRGYDWRDVMRQQAAERKEIESLGLTFGEPLKQTERLDDDDPEKKADASKAPPVRAGFNEDDHPRADDGKFGEGGGGSGKGDKDDKDDDESPDEKREREHQERQEKRDEEDADLEHARVVEDAEAIDARAKEDRQVAKDRAAEDRQTAKDRDREDAQTQRERAREDAQVERGRAREDARLDADREREDDRTLDRRAKEEERTEKARQKEEQGIHGRFEKEREGAEGDPAREKDVEERYQQALDEMVERHKEEDRADAAKREAENRKDEADRKKQDAEKGAAREKEDAEREAERDAQDARREAERGRRDEQLDARRRKEDEDREARREAEDAGLAEKREREDGDVAKQREKEDAGRRKADAAAAPAIRAAEAPRDFRIRSAAGCTITAAEGEGKLATFEGLAYSGAPMRPEGWWQPVIVDLAGVKVPSQHRPALRQHDHQQIVGHTTSVTADAKGVHVAGVFSGQPEHADKVVVPAKNGFRWQLSIGANPTRTEFLEAGEETEVNGRTVTGPLTISRETEIGEISFVPLGADGDTSATVHAQRGSETMHPFKAALKKLMADRRAAGKVKAAKYSDEDVDKMSEDDAKAALKKCMAEDEDDAKAAGKSKAKASDDDDEDEDKKAEAAREARVKAERKAQADELLRIDAVKAACRKHGVVECEVELQPGKTGRVNLAAHAIAEGWTAEKVELAALRAGRPGPGVGLPGGLGYASTAPQMSEAVLEAALLQAARHQYRLEHDDFWTERTPDGSAVRCRAGVEHVRADVQRELKARYTDQVQQAAHTLFKGRIGLHQFFRCGFASWGQDERQLDLRSEGGVRNVLKAWDHHEGIRAEGSSNLSISNILSNVLNKFALQGYLYVEQAWRKVAAIRTVTDFKPSKSINLLGDVMYKKLGPTSELQNADVADQAFSNQIDPYGRILTLPWTHLVNDDLSMLTGVPMKLGQGAGLALNDAFWSLWAAASLAATVNGVSAPTGDDGTSFWRTTSSTTKHKKSKPNKSTGAGSVLSSTSLTTARALFDNQTDPDGNPLGFDASMPILLHPPTLWRAVNELLYASVLIATGLASTAAASVQPSGNVWAGTAEPVMSRYLENASYGNSATAWYLLFNPAALPVAEVAFLNGVDTPAVLQAGPDYQFDRLGITIRGTMPFGVNLQQFRGGVFMAGA